MRLLAATAAAAACLVPTAAAEWLAGAGGDAAAKGRTMPQAAQPVVAGAGLGSVAVTWVATSFSEGGNVPGYVIQRCSWNALAGTCGTPVATGGTCADVVTGTSCTDTSVPAGLWRYTVTTAAGNWRGAASAASPAISV